MRCPQCGDREFGPWVIAPGTPRHLWCEACDDAANNQPASNQQQTN